MTAVLVVDDDPEIRDVIHVYLRNEGYSVFEAADGLQALDILQQQTVNLVILDVMMPQLDGIRTCMKIRETWKIPIIMLSAKEEDIDKINGLTTGADDYMTKPFNPLELLARVKAQLRRQSFTEAPNQNDDVIRVQDLVIDRAQHQVKVKDQEVSLTPIEFAILELLASHRGQVFHVDRIYEKVWKEASGFSDNTVMVHIRNLREKIEVNPRRPQYIKTVWGVGYKIDK
ncbi:DNA-binding response regulator [Paenibacillus selenitireducens]|uniref:DNA-binding response regulator n=1 Tax=Paenibacillus selenitireducens TaxID=1324314 RepID=A0A1T2XNI9_9BACL|nr:response regulator transcription factor [Paenibacillus selenitireducens]OPA81253.1 DNA-binding response regulator [Paenibacillus selenitireducens]